jgi:hypothetical protein
MDDFLPGCMCCFLSVSLLLTAIGGAGFGVQRHKENDLIENTCLVVDARAIKEICAVDTNTHSNVYAIDPKNMMLKNSRISDHYYTCYQPVWTVEYVKTISDISSNETRVRIAGTYTTSYIDAMNELDEYPVSITTYIF